MHVVTKGNNGFMPPGGGDPTVEMIGELIVRNTEHGTVCAVIARKRNNDLYGMWVRVDSWQSMWEDLINMVRKYEYVEISFAAVNLYFDGE
jgi:hypothetical protein